MDSMPHTNIDIVRSELMNARVRKTTFTSIEVILICYALFWLLVFTLTNNYATVSAYTVLGSILTRTRMMMFLGVVAISMIVAGFTKNKPLRCISLVMSTALWLMVSSSIFLEALNTRSAAIILSFAAAYQFIVVIRGRWSL